MNISNRELSINELDAVSGGTDNSKIAASVVENMKYTGAYVDTIIAIYSSKPGVVHGVLI